MWYYKDKIFTQNDVPLDAVGFVYQITNLQNNKKYIGKKLFWTLRKRPPLKGMKRKRIEKISSEWVDYHGSSDSLKADVLIDKTQFRRDILLICYSKAQLSYYEAKIQFDLGVLFRDDYYNGIINLRVNRRGLNEIEY